MNQTRVVAFYDEESKTSRQAIEMLAQKALGYGFVDDTSHIYSALVAREEVGSTALVRGICIPHARCESVLVPSILISRFSQPIQWPQKNGSCDVEVAICLLMPEGDRGTNHLKNLSKIARFLSDEEHIDQLLSLKDPSSLENLISDALEDE